MERFCRQVNDAIDKILRSRHTTCLFVAHRLSTIARAERIVVLEGAHVKVYFLVAAESPPLLQTDTFLRPGRTANLYVVC